MKTLFIFDECVKVETVDCLVREKKIDRIDLFPVTQDAIILNEVKMVINKNGIVASQWLNSANIINEQIENLRKGICKWSANVGEYRFWHKKIKEWLLLPGSNISVWWLSLLSEKNTFKTDAFFKIAQVHAVKTTLNTMHYDLCIVAVADKMFRKSITNVGVKLGISTRMLSVNYHRGIKTTIKAQFKNFGILDYLSGFCVFLKYLRRGYIARFHLGKLSKRYPGSQSLLFVSYFPAVERELAQKGLFRNMYALVLQDKLKEMGVPIVWLFMYVPINSYNFNNAVHMAKTFIKGGEKLFLLEEYLTFKNAIQCLLLWFKHIIFSYCVYNTVKRVCLLSDPMGDECEPIIKALWKRSFCGYGGIEGILHYAMYTHVFKKIPFINDCLYYSEMQAWEKALNAAKKQFAPNIRTIGFQHSAITKNYFHYFYDQKELICNNKNTDLPLPDVFACNGQLSYSLFSQSGYSNLARVESIRYMYLNNVLSMPLCSSKKKPFLLVAGSINEIESRNLVALVNEAFPKANEYTICFRGHPSMPFEKLFKGYDIDISAAGYTICRNNISECLTIASFVLVPSSTVAIEALAFGCEVIVPIFSNSMLMNPLSDFEGYCHKVTSGEELKKVMEKILNGYSLHNSDRYREFVRKYWCLEPGLPKWTTLLREA